MPVLPVLQSIRNSSRFTSDVAEADFVFVDMHCYHAAWMAWLHPANAVARGPGGQPSPETWIKRGIARLQEMHRWVGGVAVGGVGVAAEGSRGPGGQPSPETWIKRGIARLQEMHRWGDGGALGQVVGLGAVAAGFTHVLSLSTKLLIAGASCPPPLNSTRLPALCLAVGACSYRLALNLLMVVPGWVCRFRDTKGGDFGLVHPAPLMKGLFSEEAACEDLASVLHMVPERGGLCVWTQDSAAAGKSVLLPYAAVSDVDMEVGCLFRMWWCQGQGQEVS